jgi:UDP-hydrolysing UDP-N-acetyl-D-glucosamine 2-epimerase
MKQIIFFSSGRADLAFIYKLFSLFDNKKKYKTKVILNDYSKVDFNFFKKNNLLKVKSDTINTGKYDLINHIGKLLNNYSKLLSKTKPDYLFIVGDRYEAFAMAIVCNFLNIKIIHIAGGDISKGSYDDEMRTYISKSAYLHFVTNIQSKKNLINLAKDKSKIFNYGSPSLDYIKSINKLNKKEISQKLNINFNKYNILITFHPETKNLKYTVKNLNILLNALSSLGLSYNFFITGSNVDTFGQTFNKIIIDTVKRKKNFYFFSNLGTERYVQLANNCEIVLGNSSSLIYEIPFMGLKSILIGSRQEGRYMSKKIIKIKMNKEKIINKIKDSIKKKKPKKDLKTYGNGSASNRIFKKVDILINE